MGIAKKNNKRKAYPALIFGVLALLATSISFAGTLKIPMHLTQTHLSIGTITAKDTQYGLLLKPHLNHLPPGIHGFHVHTKPNCSQHGKAAGGHFDPHHTNQHLGPYHSNGHLGDLPVLIVNDHGQATLPILAPRLTTKMIQGHSFIIHAGGDNYSDHPKKLGGGGKRIACGIIEGHQNH